MSQVMQKKPRTAYELLKEYIQDYIAYVEKINYKRLDAAEREVVYANEEVKAFNILRNNILHLEQNGIPQN